MPRRARLPFASDALAAFARQLLFAPPDRRAQQLFRMEQVHDDLDESRAYPLDWLTFQITGYRSETSREQVLTGADAKSDLRAMIDLVSRSLDLPVLEDDPVLSPEELAARWGVTERTLSRWRALGLRHRWVRPVASRQARLVYPESGLQTFRAIHDDRIATAARYTRIPPDQRQDLLCRARRLATASGASLNRVAQHLARRTGRAHETMRQMLEKYDHDHPAQPIFTDHTSPLTPRQRRLVARAHRRGVRMSRLTQRFGRTRASMYRVVREEIAQGQQRLPLRWFELPTFARPDADEVFLSAAWHVQAGDWQTGSMTAEDLPDTLADWLTGPTLSDDRQYALLVRLNYLRYRAAMLRLHAPRYDPTMRHLRRFESLVMQAQSVKGLLMRSALPVVLAVARLHLFTADRAPRRLPSLIDDGLPVLDEAIESMDIRRPGSFDSYLRFALQRRFASEGSERDAPARAHRRDADLVVTAKILDWLNGHIGPIPSGESGAADNVPA